MMSVGDCIINGVTGAHGVGECRVLARAGVAVTILERTGQLCSGSTWHAAGLVTRFGGSSKLKKIHVRSLDLLEELHEAHDINLKLPGSIRLIERGDADRLAEAKHHLGMAKLYDHPNFVTEMISPTKISEL
jgi:glycine/D-amino acid oxidase-like deaminating enzyme